MKKKKGFTLVELLAVIVILAVILVIAVPKIMDTIQNSKEGTLMSSAKLIANQAEKKYVENQVLGITDKIECADIVKTSDADYASCDISFDSDGKASVTIAGKGKFEGMAVCNGTKTEAGISDNCYTDEACFAYDVNTSVEVISDYDVNVNKCVEFLSEGEENNEAEYKKICSGGEVNGTSLLRELMLYPDMIEVLEDEGVIYNVEIGNPVTITGYDIDCGTDVWIPDTIEGGPVINIGDYAFTTSGVSVNSVSNNNFNYNVMPLVSEVYEGLGITSVVFPRALMEIGAYSFQNNELKSVKFPSTLMTIKEEAFSDNSELVDIKLPLFMTNLEYKAFRSTGVKSIVIPGNLSTIGFGAFMSTPLETIIIEEGVTTIGQWAFTANYSIEKLVIPSTLTSIQANAFTRAFHQTKPVTIVNKNTTTTFNWAGITEKTCQTNADNIVCGNITIVSHE